MVGTLQMQFVHATRVRDAVLKIFLCNPMLTKFPVLRLDPSDQDALRTKLFLLLQTEQYDSALALIAELNEQRSFERAYALYRLHREEDATQVLEEIKSHGKEVEQRGVMHLEAQLVSV